MPLPILVCTPVHHVQQSCVWCGSPPRQLAPTRVTHAHGVHLAVETEPDHPWHHPTLFAIVDANDEANYPCPGTAFGDYADHARWHRVLFCGPTCFRAYAAHGHLCRCEAGLFAEWQRWQHLDGSTDRFYLRLRHPARQVAVLARLTAWAASYADAFAVPLCAGAASDDECAMLGLPDGTLWLDGTMTHTLFNVIEHLSADLVGFLPAASASAHTRPPQYRRFYQAPATLGRLSDTR